MYLNFIKPICDFSCSLIAIILLLPVFIILIITLLIANKGDIFFIQKRPGKNGKVFSIIKFRTMNDKKNKDGVLLPDSERLTKIGKFIRKTSLDEIPQLLNVVKFDMSIVGPRPLLTSYFHLYNSHQMRRHEVKPGITGLAQVNGRNAISWKEKFDFDVLYVDQVSLFLDIKILFMTIIKVIKFDGINAKNSATIEPFEGY
ncbi:MAG TPA: lipid carrier--UDP-N-acetylgalactosaminyltransferase [Flavobacterium sp.]|nr:lipid carrier--UDP-N-acetylgalactosaminyltransferase [Flavobacterium sp.]HAT79933.1 lipid carrier--UDP-N-acetylgalactosaminyltransferase [Flavobacterium sp.]